nr:hypothetical protein [Micromonospora tarensis]
MRVVGLELIPVVGDEDDEKLRWFCVAGVLRGHVMGSRLLGPVLALVVRAHRLAFELAAYSTFEHVGVDERVAVSVGHCSGADGRLTVAEVKVLPGTFGSACRIRGVRVSAGCSEATAAVAGVAGVVAGVAGCSVTGAHPATAAAAPTISTPLAIRTLITTAALLVRPRPE